MKLSLFALLSWQVRAFAPTIHPSRSSWTALSAAAAPDDESSSSRRQLIHGAVGFCAACAVNGGHAHIEAADAMDYQNMVGGSNTIEGSSSTLTIVAASSIDYKAVAADIAALVQADPDKGPTLVRLAWHSSGTYDKMTKTGGSGGGTIRFEEELKHGGNAGLGVTAVPWMEDIKTKYGDGLSYADLYTLAGVAAIKTMGGPTIGWSSGRTDQPVAAVTPDGRLPNADVGAKGAESSDAQHLRDIFYRMGFNDQEIVILSGAHALGRCHTTASGYDGPWTPTPTTFNNAYFTLLMNLKWVPKEWDGPYQYVDAATGRLMMLPSDLVLLQDKKFAKWVAYYAKDGNKFNADFSKAFQKLEELGTSGLTPTEWA